MAREIESFDTAAGNTFSKREDTAGRTYYVKEGDGRVSRQSYAAGKSHRPVSEIKRGTRSVDDFAPDELGEEWVSDTYFPVEAFDEGTPEREVQRLKNGFVGFANARDTPDDLVAAAVEYDDFLDALEGVKDPRERAEIKERFGVGGS